MNALLTEENSGPLRLLLVEDNPEDALLVREMLVAESGIDVRTAGSLGAARDEVAASGTDCILLDLSLPDAEGTEAVRELHRCTPTTPIVVLTGFDDELRGLEAIRAGAHDYLVKGQVGGHDLTRILRYAVERQHFTRPAAAETPDGSPRVPRMLKWQALAELYERADAAVISTELPGWTIDSWNPAAEKLFGHSAAEVIGREIGLLIPDSLRAEAEAARESVLAGEPVLLETRRLHRDGRELDVALTMAPLTDATGVVGVSALVVDISAKASAVRALRRAEERFRGAFAHAPSGMGVVSLDADSYGRLLQVNPALCELTGYAESELLTNDFAPLMRLDPAGEEVAALRELVRGERETYGLEKEIERADGTSVWLQVAASIIRDDAGRPLYGLGQVQDVTARKRAERARSRLAAIVDSSADAIVATDVDGRIAAWNPGAETLYGQRQADVIGAPFSLLVAPDAADRDRDALAAVLSGRALSPYEAQRVRGDGSVVDVSVSISAIRDHDGCIVGASEIARDITSDRAAAAALADSEERLRQIVETANEGIWTLDPSGQTMFANKKIAEILGTTVAELETASVFDFVSAADREATARHLSPGQAGVPGQLQLRFARADGGEAWGLLSVSPLSDADGTETGALVMVADVTARMAAEGERQRMERKLQQWERLESLGQLAGGVAHDMNNLLGVILNFSDFGLDLVGAGPGSEELVEIRAAAERAATLTRQLLLFARREVVRPEIVDLNELLADLEKLLKRTIGEHIVLTARHSPALPSVSVDPGLVEQVLVNLVVNARDAMLEGGEITITTGVADLAADELGPHVDLAPGAYVCLSVADEGHGMTKDVAARAFDPFFTTKPPGSGTGLGLATVYGVVTKAGGRVQLYSEVGRGTVVRVYLPVSNDERTAPRVPEIATVAAGDGTVLVVEDDERLRRVTARILGEHGYDVLVAHTPADALELARYHGDALDLLVTDVVMPEMSGAQLAVELGRTHPDLPIVFVSGYTERPHELPDGARFLSKPFTRAELLREVADVREAAGSAESERAWS